MTQPTLKLDEMKRKWIDDAVAIFPSIGITKHFTTDELHNLFTAPPHPNHWGSLMASLKKRGWVVKAGYRVSTRPSANCRPVSLWEIV